MQLRIQKTHALLTRKGVRIVSILIAFGFGRKSRTGNLSGVELSRPGERTKKNSPY